MDEFLKDRQIEKETYAIINYFKVLKLAEMTIKEDKNKDSFQFVGGNELLKRLEVDYQEGRINIFEDSITDLFDKLENNIVYISSLTSSKSYFTDKAVKEFEFIKRNFEENWIHYEQWTTDPSSNVFLLIMQALPEEVYKQILSLKQKQKKIGER